MNTTKKLLVLVMVALMAAVSVMPSTFSWYDHNGVANGGKINYNDTLDVSMKSDNNKISMSTVKTDAKGVEGDAVSDGISVNAAASASTPRVQYYKTTLTNTGTNDVMVDLETTNFPNNADFSIGTVSPTLNEKAYAAKPTKKDSAGGFVRVYFKSNQAWKDFWVNGSGNNYETNNDMNIAYKDSTSADYHYELLHLCTGTSSQSAWDKVYYYDLPSDTSTFFFFNHWYFADTTNPRWNKTLDITNLVPGTLYYLTGGKVGEQEKEYSTQPVNTNLVAVNKYYTDVQMSLGNSVFADIGLKKDSDDDDEDFVPQYYGSSISYTSSDTSVVTVSKDGLLTPKASGNANITTTITGQYGDTKAVTTSVKIPDHITQVPIIQNVKLCAKDSTDDKGNPTDTVDIYWYAMNKSTTNNLTTTNIFLTI